MGREPQLLAIPARTRDSRLATRDLPRAFTLVELLVVITIIGILAALIGSAAVGAMNKANQARITLEIQQLSSAMETFKNDPDLGGAYPPNGMYTSEYTVAKNDFVRMFRKAFPRNNEPPELIEGLAGNSGSGSAPAVLVGGMNGAEAIVFWLGGFSKDSQYPLSGPGGPSYDASLGLSGEDLEGRNRTYEFDLGRLGPRDSEGAFDTDEDNDGGQGRFITYDIGGTTRRINMWYYTPSGSLQPYGYFDASRHRAQVQTGSTTYAVDYDPWFGQIPGPGGTLISLYALKRLNETNPNRYEFVNRGKFQILHAGIDDEWGEGFSFFQLNGSNPPDLFFPEGPFTGDIADTLSNFSTGTLESEQE